MPGEIGHMWQPKGAVEAFYPQLERRGGLAGDYGERGLILALQITGWIFA